MNHATFMGGFQPLRDLFRDGQGFLGRFESRERDGYKNGYSGEKRRAWIFVPAQLITL